MFKRLYIEVANICNLNCSFCPKSNRDQKVMSIDEFETISNKITKEFNQTNGLYGN